MDVIAPLQPDEKRHCTDLLCNLIWWAFIAGMIGVAGFALAEGDYRLVVNGIDFRGCVCGTDYLGDACSVNSGPTTQSLGSETMFVASYDESWTTIKNGDVPDVFVICAHSCISEGDPQLRSDLDGVENVAMFCYDTETSAMIFPDAGAATVNEIITDLENKGCTEDEVFVTFESMELFGYCLPDVNSAFMQAVDDETLGISWTESISSISNGWEIMLGACFLAVAIGIVYIFLLNWCATPLTLISIVAIQILLIMGGVMLVLEANKVADAYTGENADDYTSDETWQMNIAGACIAFIIAALYLCIMIFMWSRIMLALRMVGLASKAVVANCCMVFFPFYMTLLGVGVIAFWATTAVFLFSIGEVTSVDNSFVPGGVVKTVELDDTARYALLYHLVGLFWVPQFLTAFTEMVIAFVATAWLFAPRDERHRRKMPSMPVCKACLTTARYHIGTLAFGSLIVAIIQMIRFAFEFVYHRVRKANRNSTCVKAVYCMCSCCFYCLERCMKFINSNAYILVTLTKQGFCSSASQAFGLILSNLARVGALAAIATSFAFLGKLFIACSATALAYFVFTSAEPYNDPTSVDYVAPFVPCLIIFVFSYAVGMIMMTVYHTTVDAMLFSYMYAESHPHALDEQARQVMASINEDAHKRFGTPYDAEEESLKTNPAAAAGGARPTYE